MNLPNLLSLLRLALVGVFPAVFFSGAPHANLWAALVYAVACATDVLDGILARRLNMITKLGRILDPTADKLMAAMVIFCIATQDPILWWAVGVFCCKEALMGIGALVQYKKMRDVSPSQLFGKLSAVFFFLVCVALLIFPALPAAVKLPLILAALALNFVSLALYFVRFMHQMKNLMNK